MSASALRRPYEELHAENQRLSALIWLFVEENRGNPDFENLAYSEDLKAGADVAAGRNLP